MDVWEQMVGSYLTLDPAVFVQPQYRIHCDNWEAYPDFVAIDFRRRIVWMVEVSIGLSTLKRIDQLEAEFFTRITHQLRECRVIDEDPGWRCGFWVFTKKDSYSGALAKIKSAKIYLYEVTSLEDVVKDWLNGNAWNKRTKTFQRNNPQPLEQPGLGPN